MQKLCMLVITVLWTMVLYAQSPPVLTLEKCIRRAEQNRFLQPYYFNQVWASVHADWSLGDLIQKTG